MKKALTVISWIILVENLAQKWKVLLKSWNKFCVLSICQTPVISLVLQQLVYMTQYYSTKKKKKKAKVIMKVIFESHGRFKLTEKWLHKNVLYLH